MQYNAILHNTMQYLKVTKYTIWYNDMQVNTMRYYKIQHISEQNRAFLALKRAILGNRPVEQPNGHVSEKRRYQELPQDMPPVHSVGKLWSNCVGPSVVK